MKSDNFVVIQGFMCNELNLKGNDLLVFALIYGFCQDGASKFSGGRKYIADTFNISLPTVDKALNNLIGMGYILKESSNDYVHPDTYRVRGSKETLLGVVKKLYEGGKETLPNNIDKKIVRDNNSDKSELEPTPPIKRTLIAVGIPNTESKPVKKKNLYEKCVDAINEFTSDTDIRSYLLSYLRVRLEMACPLYFNQWSSYLKELARLQSIGQDVREVIQQSINRGYRGFYEVKQYSKQSKGQDPSVFNEFGKVKTGKGLGGSLTNVQF